MSDNPFLDAQPTVADAPNPFLLPSQQKATEIVRSADGKKLRPDGSTYSSDPSERARQLRADGKIGPEFGKLGGGRKRQHVTAAKAVAEMAAEEAEAIKQVFRDGIDPSSPVGIRLAAAEKILKIEGEQVDREIRAEQAEFDRMNKEQLVGSVLEMLGELGAAGALAREVQGLIGDGGGEIVDADVVEP